MIKIHNKNIQNLKVDKTGAGTTYFSYYQNYWQANPSAVEDNFRITTLFESNGKGIVNLEAGEKATMIVNVNALKDAEYIMIEIPIPAGCTIASKNQNILNAHKEFMKDKVLIFLERMNKGEHDFRIELEPRYRGTFTLNPAKVSLMYFPTFFGRNAINTIDIR